jgi:hypothetical protein
MPGWGIVVNLVPPEVLVARRVRVIHKLIVSFVGAIVVLAGLAYGYAYWQVHTASGQLSAAEAQTAQLHQGQQKYGVVLSLQAETSHVINELKGLTAATVDLPALVNKVIALSPNPRLLTKVDVEETAAAPPGTTSMTASNPTGSLDTSGQLQIGTITVTGAAVSVAQVSGYVHRLAQVPGIVEVFPVTAQTNGRYLDFTVQMTMTDQLLSRGAAALSSQSTLGGN